MSIRATPSRTHSGNQVLAMQLLRIDPSWGVFCSGKRNNGRSRGWRDSEFTMEQKTEVNRIIAATGFSECAAQCPGLTTPYGSVDSMRENIREATVARLSPVIAPLSRRPE